MTTNKPEVVAYSWQCHGRHSTVDKKFADELAVDGEGVDPLIRLSDYERLQAETERLQAECEELRKDAAFYRRLRSLTYEQLGQPGVPCVAVPEADNRGRFVAGEDLDAAMQEASHDS